jgi:hypothetical protein
LDNLICTLDAKFALTEGNNQQALELYKKLWANPDNRQRAKVNINFDLATAYGHLAEPEKQKSCLKHVATHGKKLYKANKAREMLKPA